MDVLLFRALALLGLAILVALAARRLRLPYTVGLVLAGAALAATRIQAGLALTHDLIFDVVLPPLLFEAALNLRWSDLRRDLVPVVALSTIGVVLCALAVAGGLVVWLGWPIESGTRLRSADRRDRPDRGHCAAPGIGRDRPAAAPHRGREPVQRRRRGGPVHAHSRVGGP